MLVRSVPIAMRMVEGAHTGENIAAVVALVISDYKLDKNRGFFVTGNG